jgi:succinoglycan biosynthesis transport protein ExoP
MPPSSNAVILELVDRVLRSWWTLVAGVSLGLAGAMTALHYLPKTYESSTTIFVAPQQIPQDFVKSTVTDDMSIRLAALREAVLSRPYLTKLVKETLGTQADAEEMERTIKSMRSRIEVQVMENEREGSRSGGVFRLTYRDKTPQRAAQVVNTLADFYIERNVSFRNTQAEGTTRTIESLANDVLAQLQVQERSVADFKSHHLYDTQVHFEANVQLLHGRQQDLATLERDLGLARDKVQTLKAQEAQWAISGATDVGGAAVLDPYASRLSQLQREYEALRARYRDDHPDVRAKKRELDDFVAGGDRAAGSPGAPTGDGTGSSPSTPLRLQIQAAEREVARLETEQNRLRGEIETYKRRIEDTPRVEQQLGELSKGLDVLRERYKDYQTKVEEAKGSQKIEATQKGERFEVIERATPPTLPVRPLPLLVYAVCLAGGLALLVGPVALRALLVPVISSETGLRDLVSVPVLVAVPRLFTRDVVRSTRNRRLRNVGASVASVTILALALTFFGTGL